jgi:hypothetical protein
MFGIGLPELLLACVAAVACVVLWRVLLRH